MKTNLKGTELAAAIPLPLAPRQGLQHLQAGSLQECPNWPPASDSPSTSTALLFTCCPRIFLIRTSDCHPFAQKTTSRRRVSPSNFAGRPRLTFPAWLHFTLAMSHLCTSHKNSSLTRPHSRESARWLIMFSLARIPFPFPAKLLPGSHGSSLVPSPRKIFHSSWLPSCPLTPQCTFKRL